MPKKNTPHPAGPGRPRAGVKREKMSRYGIFLTKKDAARIRNLGEGNLSAGVRRLAEDL